MGNVHYLNPEKQALNLEENLTNITDSFNHKIKNRVEFLLSKTLHNVDGAAGNQDKIFIIPTLDDFSILTDLFGWYTKTIGIDRLHEFVDKIDEQEFYSKHIVDKLRKFLNSGEVYFNFEAQFDPTVIRRTEKNLFYATTFVMVVSRFIIDCNQYIFHKLQLLPPEIHINRAERCDRSSLRLLQDIALSLKNTPLTIKFIFPSIDNGQDEKFLSDNIELIKASRRKVFAKLISLASVSGLNDDLTSPREIDQFLGSIDFISGIAPLIESWEPHNNLSSIDSCLDFFYKSNYQMLLSAFISVKSSYFDDSAARLEIMFIISTVIENTLQIAALTGDHSTLSELFDSYEYILDMTRRRIRASDYKKSFIISFTHALLPINLQRAEMLADNGEVKEARLLMERQYG